MTAIHVTILSQNLDMPEWFDLYRTFNDAINGIKARFANKKNVKVFLGDILTVRGRNVQRITIEYDGGKCFADSGVAGKPDIEFIDRREAMFAMEELDII